MKSILTFEKWTKINVHFWIFQNTLTDGFFCLDRKNLSSQFKPKKLFFVIVIFIFFAEKYLGIFSVIII